MLTTIPMTGRTPITLDASRWECYAETAFHGEFEFQATRLVDARVYVSPDGRAVVSASYATSWQDETSRHAGIYLADTADVHAIAAALDECIALIDAPLDTRWLADAVVARLDGELIDAA